MTRRNLLLTGAAGLIGGEVAAQLVARGHRVTALVHRSRDVLANDGTPVALGRIEGDVTRPSLGVEPKDLAAIDLIVHAAAATRFDHDEATYRAVNVDGTRHALALAEALGCPLLHVSTAYVCGPRDGRVREDDPLGTRFANGYEASKAEAERMLKAAGSRVATARPSIVLGHSRTGMLRRFGAIPGLFRALAHGLIGALPAAPDATLDIVPIDHVAAGIAAMAERIETAAGAAFHITSGAPLAMGDLRTAICERPDFCCPAFIPPAEFDPGRLAPAQRRLFARAVAAYAPYLQRDPRFDDRSFRTLTGLAAPPAGLTYLRRLIDYAVAVGFLKPATARR